MAFIRQQSLAHEYKKPALLTSGQLQIEDLPLKLKNNK
jgi:6,7-dimethyl-8-ribityllumazine synthase